MHQESTVRPCPCYHFLSTTSQASAIGGGSTVYDVTGKLTGAIGAFRLDAATRQTSSPSFALP
jgi:hypothetical protein